MSQTGWYNLARGLSSVYIYTGCNLDIINMSQTVRCTVVGGGKFNLELYSL